MLERRKMESYRIKEIGQDTGKAPNFKSDLILGQKFTDEYFEALQAVNPVKNQKNIFSSELLQKELNRKQLSQVLYRLCFIDAEYNE